MKLTYIVAYALIVACSALTAWSAWDRGGGYYSTQMIVAFSLLPLGLLAILSQYQRRPANSGGTKQSFLNQMQPPLLVGLAIAVLGFAFMQTLPMPKSVAAIMAPVVEDLKSDWLPVAMMSGAADSGAQLFAHSDTAAVASVSISPTYTRLALLGPASFAVMTWVCFLCFRFSGTMVVFLSAIAGSGAAFSFFGLIDTVRLVRDWQAELRQMLAISPVGAGDPFGPFVNNNNASGFLCLAIGCTLGLLVLVEQLFAFSKARSSDCRNEYSPGLIIARLGAAALLVTLVAGVIGSNSRGGFLGLLAGSLVVLLFLFPRFSKLKLGLLISGVVSLSWLVIFGLGFGTRSQSRVETLLDKRIMDDPRLDHWSDALVAAVHYMPYGSGLGTYRYACLPFQKNGAPLWFVNADGMPIEWFVEGGVWLLPLIVLGLIILLRDVVWIDRGLKYLEGSDTEVSSSAGASVAYAKCIWVVALFCIPALLVTQCFDFGVTLMPVLLTFAGISGAILRMSTTIVELRKAKTAASDGQQDSPSKSIPSGRLFAKICQASVFSICRQMSGPVALVLVIAALGIVGKELYVASVAQEEMIWLRRERKQQLLVDMPSLPERLAQVKDLALANPRNAMIWKALGELRLAEQQRLGALRLFQLQPATVDSHASWLSTKTLRHACYGEEPVSFEACLLPTQTVNEYVEAREDFLRSLLLNPLDPSVRISLLELDMVAPKANGASAELLLQAARLRPRSDSFLRYLLWLAEDHPGVQGLAEIEAMRETLRAERLRAERPRAERPRKAPEVIKSP